MTKHAFWQALVFTILVFSLGMILGFFLEVKQSGNIYSNLVASELNILDEQIRQRISLDSNISCDLAKESLFSFADKIYSDATNLEEVDGTGRISDLITLHRRYDLLRTLLFLEADKLKERCNTDFHIVTYFYAYNAEDIETSSKQNYYSGQVYDLKLKHPTDVIIIPIAVDTQVASVDLLVDSLKLRQVPAIVVDGNIVITEVLTLEELEGIVFSNTNSP
jgi:hypothetical protein